MYVMNALGVAQVGGGNNQSALAAHAGLAGGTPRQTVPGGATQLAQAVAARCLGSRIHRTCQPSSIAALALKNQTNTNHGLAIRKKGPQVYSKSQ
jgi:hypothetical protein